MPLWMTSSNTLTDEPILTVITRLVIAWGAGWGVALVATRNPNRETTDTLPATLVLMSILIAMATQIIGDNVARAFSLVGALSIVRFRTAVPTSRDVAFVLASVVVGMAIGAGQLVVATIGLAVVALASRFEPSNLKEVINQNPGNCESRLTIQVALTAGELPLATLKGNCSQLRLLSATTTRKGAAMTYVYAITAKPNVPIGDVIQSLNQIPDVESVAWEASRD